MVAEAIPDWTLEKLWHNSWGMRWSLKACGWNPYLWTYIYTVESCTSSHMEVNMLMVSILLLKLQSQMSCSILSSRTVNFSSTGSEWGKEATVLLSVLACYSMWILLVQYVNLILIDHNCTTPNDLISTKGELGSHPESSEGATKTRKIIA